MKHLSMVSKAPVQAQDMTTEEKLALIVDLITALEPIIAALIGDKDA